MGKPGFVRGALVLSAAGWLLVTGCTSSSTGNQPITGSGPLSTQLAQAYCARQAICCTAGATATDGGATPDAAGTVPCPATEGDAGTAQCVAHAELAAEQQLALIGTAYAEGLVAINAAVVKACVAAYQARACDAVLNVEQALSDTACAGVFIGYIPVGERCDTTVECAAGSYCLSQSTGQSIASISGGGTLGVCFAYQKADAGCNSTADCLPPLTCGATTGVCQ
jgi:hypothetical protein